MQKKKLPYSGLLLTAVAIVLLCGAFTVSISKGKNYKVLVFSKTNGYRHASIEEGIAAIKLLGQQNNFSVVATEDSLALNSKNLKQYKAVIFLSTTGSILGDAGEAALKQFIEAGGGFAGVHGAADCEYNRPWYVQLVGGSFESHPEQQQAKLLVKDASHPSARHLPAVWERKDEWYNFKNLNPAVTTVLTIDEGSYKGGKNGAHHPMAWYHTVGKGRAFYTALGHTNECYKEAAFLQHLLGGIQYAAGIK
jgi:uncharacterized protein